MPVFSTSCAILIVLFILVISLFSTVTCDPNRYAHPCHVVLARSCPLPHVSRVKIRPGNDPGSACSKAGKVVQHSIDHGGGSFLWVGLKSRSVIM